MEVWIPEDRLNKKARCSYCEKTILNCVCDEQTVEKGVKQFLLYGDLFWRGFILFSILMFVVAVGKFFEWTIG